MEYKDESCASGGGGIGSVPKTKAHLKQLGIPDRKRTIPLYVFQVFPHYIIAVFNSPAGGGGGYSIYPWMGRCGAAPHTLTLFKTNIADFPPDPV